MKLSPETHRIQSDFSAYCRTGQYTSLPGTRPEGLKQYRRLVFGVVRDAIENSYPIASDFLAKKTWDEMLQDFFSNHKCESPQVWNIAGEFFDYAVAMKWQEKYALPLLTDLLQFEWAETEMYNMPDAPKPNFSPEGDLLADLPVFNPEFRIFQLSYPVHKMHPEKAIENPGQYFVLMFRDPDIGKIHFMDLSVFWVWMLDQMAGQHKTCDQAILTAQSVFEDIDARHIGKKSRQFMQHLKEKSFVLGFATGTNVR